MFGVIQPASPFQFDSLFDLRWRVLRAPWNQPRGSERDAYEDESYHAMIEHEGICVATGRLQQNSKGEGQIRFMAVDPSMQGKGLGKKILEFLEAEAGRKSMTKIILQARENAVPFYEAQGYRLIEKSFLLFGTIQHYLMSKEVAQ